MKLNLPVITLLFICTSAVAQAKVIVSYGDSTEAGATMANGVYKTAEFTPPDLLQMMIDKKCGAGLHTVVNKGVGGSSALSARTTGLYAGKTFAQDIASSNADIILANWGINDNFIPGNNKWLYTYDHTLMAQAAHAAGKIYIAVSSQPTAYYPPRESLYFFKALVVWRYLKAHGYLC